MRFAKQISLITALLLAVSLGSIVSIAVKHLWTGVLEVRHADLVAFDRLLYSSLQSASVTALADATTEPGRLIGLPKKKQVPLDA